MARYTVKLILIILVVLVSTGCSGNQREFRLKLDNVKSWAYLIQNQSVNDNLKKIRDSRYDLVVIDQTSSLKGEENFDSKAEVNSIKKSENSSGGKKIVLCYLDIGEAESYRRYWQKDWGIGTPEWILAADPDGWDGNYPVKFWHPEWRQIMEKSIDQIISDGYDGVYLDWVEIYFFPPVVRAAKSEGTESKKEIVKFISDIAAHARSKKPGFIVVVQNGAELGKVKKYRDAVDAIAQEAVWFDGGGDPDESEKVGDVAVAEELTAEYLTSLKVWSDNGKKVFNVEYATEDANVGKAHRLGRKHKFITNVTIRSLDRLSDPLSR